MRCLFAKRDALHEYAAFVVSMLEDVVGQAPVSAKDFGGTRCAILQRNGRFQVELIDMQPGMAVPTHTHPGADGIEYCLSGEGVMTVGGESVAADYEPARRAAFLKGKAIRVAGETPHSVVVGAQGFRFLSIQHWRELKPRHVGEHWVGAPSSKVHEQILRRLN